MSHKFDCDFLVVGGGSGGVRAARLAASLGKKTAIVEQDRFGGTCVIRGCVPKKLLVYASRFGREFNDARGFGWSAENIRFDWPSLIEAKNKEISRLEALYRAGLEKAGAAIFDDRAVLIGTHEVRLEGSGESLSAERILLAVGSAPDRLDDLPGAELCIDSGHAFELPEAPDSVVIYGGGYIAVEFACLFAGLGVETTLVYRGKRLLRNFDHDLGESLCEAMRESGISVLLERRFERVEKHGEGKRVRLDDGTQLSAGQVMLATGRKPNVSGLGLESAGIELDPNGSIPVDGFSRTRHAHILALGDATGGAQLTPLAIHDAMRLVRTEFLGDPFPPGDELIPTAIFTEPEIGTVGMSEEQASGEYEELKVFLARFRPLKHTLSGREEKTLMKLIVDARSDKVVGVHIFGEAAGEMIQALAVAMTSGATKGDFDRTLAVHPTSAEELVTMYEPTYRIVAGKREG